MDKKKKENRSKSKADTRRYVLFLGGTKFRGSGTEFGVGGTEFGVFGTEFGVFGTEFGVFGTKLFLYRVYIFPYLCLCLKKGHFDPKIRGFKNSDLGWNFFLFFISRQKKR